MTHIRSSEMQEWSSLEMVERGVEQFADGLRQDTKDDHPYTQAAISSYLSVLEAGGKRTRGMLTVLGYEMHGGENRAMISEAAGAIEACHAYLLVVDDVADNSPTRRGKPTAHVALQEFLEARQSQGNVPQIAADMAISAAFAATHKAETLFAELDAPDANKLRVIRLVNKHLARTCLGQVLDMASPSGAPMSQKDIIGVATSKTAFYSFDMPLNTGAILAGAPESSQEQLSRYSLHTGLAFQMQDDIMGVFGDEKKTGKPAKSDIIEGKQTLLFAYALEGASLAETDVLQQAHGNPYLSDRDFERCRDLLITTGARERVQTFACEQVERALTVLDTNSEKWPTDKVTQLRDMASFVIDRSS